MFFASRRRFDPFHEKAPKTGAAATLPETSRALPFCKALFTGVRSKTKKRDKRYFLSYILELYLFSAAFTRNGFIAAQESFVFFCNSRRADSIPGPALKRTNAAHPGEIRTRRTGIAEIFGLRAMPPQAVFQKKKKKMDL